MSEKQSKGENIPARTEPTYSDRFTGMVVKEYSSSISNVKLSEYQRKLAQHLFVKIDIALRDFEIKRLSKPNASQKLEYSWKNINLQKLSVDAVHRIELGLDALIPNHIHPVPYHNTRLGKYDIDLRIGYAGKDFYYRQMSLHPIIDIEYELVHENDDFTVIKKQVNQGVESYSFEIPEPFNRGAVVGGFGYIRYENESMNKLVLVTTADFDKSKASAMSNEFWSKHPEAMKYKTIVHRTVNRIVLDPQKINSSFAQVEHDELKTLEHQVYEQAEEEAEKNANQQIIDIDPPDNTGDPEPEQEGETDGDASEEPSEEEQQEIYAREMAEAESGSGPGF